MDSGVQEEDFSSQNVNPVISSIQESPAGYKCILSDGTSFFVAMHHFYGRQLRTGAELNDQDIEYLEHEDRFYHAWRQAARYLEIRDHSSYELSLKLRKKGFTREIAAQVCADLAEKRIINDEKFAVHFLAALIRKNRFSETFLLRKMIARGIDRKTGEKLLGKCFTDQHRQEALGYAVRKALQRAGQDRERLILSLQKKGFRYSDIIQYLKMNEI
ncbi:MAG: RecX family transcriptional regulator [Spirochaetales bacterium]|nr:RecX family transcriptional regulator [Spirochaetales bacterium]